MIGNGNESGNDKSDGARGTALVRTGLSAARDDATAPAAPTREGDVRGVGILITGNEVLFGKTRDTNGPFMAAHLRRAGREVKRSLVSGDDRVELARALRYLSETCDTVLMTGGLGPTSDDLTAEVVGAFLGLPLDFSEPAWRACIDAFARMGRTEVPETNRKQALLPRGCRLIPNGVGTAVGFAASGSVEGRALTLVCLPGVPFEMEPMFLEHVLPGLGDAEAVVTSRSWQVFGLGESTMQQKVAALEERVAREVPEAIVSYQAHAGYVTYALFAPARGDARASAVRGAVEGWFTRGVEEAFGTHVIARTEKSLAPYLVEAYAAAGVTLAVAESCTGGLVSKEIVAVPGSSACYLGGVTAYANALKSKVLGVPEALLATHGAVSEETARAMAEGAVDVLGSDVAIAITGVAGPSGGSDRAPVGTICLGLAWRESAVDSRRLAARLAPFRWKEAPVLENGRASDDDVGSMVVTLALGKRMRRDVIQLRSSVFALGSLALVASAFIREQQ